MKGFTKNIHGWFHHVVKFYLHVKTKQPDSGDTGSMTCALGFPEIPISLDLQSSSRRMKTGSGNGDVRTLTLGPWVSGAPEMIGSVLGCPAWGQDKAQWWGTLAWLTDTRPSVPPVHPLGKLRLWAAHQVFLICTKQVYFHRLTWYGCAGKLYCYHQPRFTGKETKTQEESGSAKVTLLAKKQSQDSDVPNSLIWRQIHTFPTASWGTVKNGH